MYCFSSRFSMTARTLPRCFLPDKSSQNETCGQVLLAAWDSTAEKKTLKRKCSLKEIFTEHRKVRREGAAKALRRGVRRQRGDGREAGGDGREEKQEENSRKFKTGGFLLRLGKEKELQGLEAAACGAGSMGPGDDNPPAAEALTVAGRQKDTGQGTVYIAIMVITTAFDVAGPKHVSKILGGQGTNGSSQPCYET